MRWVCVLAFGLGCYTPHPQPGQPCTTSPCPAGLECIAGTCEPPGTMPSDAAGSDATDATDAPAPNDAKNATAQLVQQATAVSGTGTTLDITLPTLPQRGNVLVMIGAAIHSQLDSTSGGGIASWQVAARSTDNTNVEIWYGTTDGSSARVTIALSTNVGPIWGLVTEWSGLEMTSTLDIATATSGVTSPASAGSVTTAHVHDLLIFAASDPTPNMFGTPGFGSWTALSPIDSTMIQQDAWYRIVAAAQNYNTSVSETDHSWDAALAAFAIAP